MLAGFLVVFRLTERSFSLPWPPGCSRKSLCNETLCHGICRVL